MSRGLFEDRRAETTCSKTYVDFESYCINIVIKNKLVKGKLHVRNP